MEAQIKIVITVFTTNAYDAQITKHIYADIGMGGLWTCNMEAPHYYGNTLIGNGLRLISSAAGYR
jgi:hypothetical protein